VAAVGLASALTPALSRKREREQWVWRVAQDLFDLPFSREREKVPAGQMRAHEH